jgi:hypothetical protein
LNDTITQPPAPTTATPSRPVLRMIRASELSVDLYKVDAEGRADGYQRDPDAKFAKLLAKMKQSFCPDLYTPLSVAEWEGKFYVYDGNCRRTLATEVGKDPGSSPAAAEYFRTHPEIVVNDDGSFDPLLECRVSYRCEPNRQAWLFVRCNEDRRGVPWLSRHHANLFQNDPTAIEIERIVKEVGLEIGRGRGKLSAVQALYSTVRFDGDDAPLRSDLLRDVLRVANEAWSKDRTAQDAQYAFSDRTLDALALVLDEFDESAMPRDRAITAFRRVLARDLINRAAKKTSAHGSNNASELAKQMVLEYNKQSSEFPTGHRLRINRLDPVVRRERMVAARRKAKLREKARSAA